ncbi:hypothetical protein GCM10011320_31330 [Neoroseomonas lacus]|uniref:Uncharacterized protein n=1 Tax=Neoroseomonas lacus TaxID=287609 RepID=A0A917KN24_9PROT|nr:hypothetical protein GCM10011320_31330 [Neoroseomonas lacus]
MRADWTEVNPGTASAFQAKLDASCALYDMRRRDEKSTSRHEEACAYFRSSRGILILECSNRYNGLATFRVPEDLRLDCSVRTSKNSKCEEHDPNHGCLLP